MEQFNNWVARRSGDSITIQAKALDGTDVKISGVEQIQSDDPYPIAVDRKGSRYQLA